MIATAAERAQRGEQFLDVKVPGWPAMVDTLTLDLMDQVKCVLGQITPHLRTCDCDPEVSPYGWFLFDDHAPGVMDDPEALGFEPIVTEEDVEDVDGDFSRAADSVALTEAWRQIITTKRAALVRN